jgi:hemerythrin-like domain-containing protein
VERIGPIEMLNEEHRLLERVLKALQSFVVDKVVGENLDGRQQLVEFVRFLRAFDQLHHLKEEEILFGWMSQNGYSQTEGPLAELFKEHTGFRHLLGRLDLAARASSPWDSAAREQLLTVANTYVAVLEGHIVDEEELFSSLKLESLADSVLRPVVKAFVDYDSQHDKRALYQQAHRLQPGAGPPDSKRATLPPPSASLPPSTRGGPT